MLKEGLKLVEREADEEFFNDSTKSFYDDVSGRDVPLASECGCSSHDAVLPTASNSSYTTSSSDMLSTTSTKEPVLLNEEGNIKS